MSDINGNEVKFEVPEYLVTAKKDAINNCAMLYCGTKKPPTESLMCFGWECGDGWNAKIAELSYSLEMMNMLLYPKYRTRIEAEQIKEKFGYFRGYFSVVTDQPFLRGLPSAIFRKLYDVLNRRVNYAYKRVVDVEGGHREEWDEISKEDFDFKKAPDYVENPYGWKFKEENGKYYRNSCVYFCEKAHNEPTKHKFLYKIMNIAHSVSCFLYGLTYKEPTRKQRVAAEFMNTYMEELVDETERKCHGVCEYCGTQIGTHFEERCETNGWISYICKDCAKSHNLEYINERGDVCNPDGSIKVKAEDRDAARKSVLKIKVTP